jgi:hypothetical protein
MEAFTPRAEFAEDPKIHGVKGLVYIGDKILVYTRGTEKGIPYRGCVDLPGGGC